jgi:hypothetical protein
MPKSKNPKGANPRSGKTRAHNRSLALKARFHGTHKIYMALEKLIKAEYKRAAKSDKLFDRMVAKFIAERAEMMMDEVGRAGADHAIFLIAQNDSALDGAMGLGPSDELPDDVN